MDKKQLAAMIDHTLLKPAKKGQLDALCNEAVQYGFASVCVNPDNVKYCAKLLLGTAVKVCTVIGFPRAKIQPLRRYLKLKTQSKTAQRKSIW